MGVCVKNIRTLFVSFKPFLLPALFGFFIQDPIIIPDFISYDDLEKQSVKYDVIVINDETINEKGLDALMNNFITKFPSKKIIFTNSRNKKHIASFISPQIDGIINKDSGIDLLRKCILEVAKGRKYYCDSVEKILLRNEGGQNFYFLKNLTIREKEILFLIKDGMTNREIANKICISIKTVGRHKENIKNKLGLHHLNEFYEI